MFGDWRVHEISQLHVTPNICWGTQCCQGAKASFLAPRWRSKGGYNHRPWCPAVGWQGTSLELWLISYRGTKSKCRGAATKSGTWGGYLSQTQTQPAVYQWRKHGSRSKLPQIMSVSICVLKPRHCSSEHKFFRRSWSQQKACRWGSCEKSETLETLGQESLISPGFEGFSVHLWVPIGGRAVWQLNYDSSQHTSLNTPGRNNIMTLVLSL